MKASNFLKAKERNIFLTAPGYLIAVMAAWMLKEANSVRWAGRRLSREYSWKGRKGSRIGWRRSWAAAQCHWGLQLMPLGVLELP